MFLKSLELNGFKSFPVRTKLEFGPGMTSIVGPNGCGKSNISDAIRWVLGEQSAKLLRSSKMEDCIFSGTDDRKPLGMAEISLTLAECENTLATDYHEVTVTRRVFRSGEGQYFINKTSCRLKDIQRLFMDTGIGTNSYSLMEQGRVDLILSSRPEDRRSIFEEASGITKYKTDKREALRKLDQTEINLTRLADIIKEAKRQIISIQRQAGKARRVKKFRDELRSMDIFVSRETLQTMDTELQSLETRMASLTETIEAFQQDIQSMQQKNEALRNSFNETERNITSVTQNSADLRAKLDQTRQSIDINQNRIKELQEFIQRDSDDTAKANRDIEKERQTFEQAQKSLEKANNELIACEKSLRDKSQQNAEHEQAQEKITKEIDNLRTNSMELESRLSKHQNKLNEMEAGDRTIVNDRERTAAEKSNLTRLYEGYNKKQSDFSEILNKLNSEVSQAETELELHLKDHSAVSDSIKTIEVKRAECLVHISADKKQIDFLNNSFAEDSQAPDATEQVLDKADSLAIDRSHILGALAQQLDTQPEFQTALKAALRFWLEAVVITDMADALILMRALEGRDQSALQLLVADMPEISRRCASAMACQGGQESGVGGQESDNNGEQYIPLWSRVSCPDRIRPLVERLLANVFVIESLDNLPVNIPSQTVYVTRRGALVKGSGVLECYRMNLQANNPLARKHLLSELEESIASLQSELKTYDTELTELKSKQNACQTSAQQARSSLEEKKQAFARQEGENQSIRKQADQTRENLETVTWELQELEKHGSSVETRSAIITEMDQISAQMAENKVTIVNQNLELKRLEQEQKHIQTSVMEANIRFAQCKQTVEHLKTQCNPMAERITEHEELINNRSLRITRYQSDLEDLRKAISDAQEQIPLLNEEIQRVTSSLNEIREQRKNAQSQWEAIDEKIKANRESLDECRNQQNELNGKCIEYRMKRQNVVDRITSEYRMPADAIRSEPEPEWPDGKPDMETLENTIGELRAKIEAIGPVYEGAIEEYEQLQERSDFLNRQQDDLVKSKQQLRDMIRKINKTTIELFTQTFAAVNDNFQTTFKQLFGGGSAKLMLADEEDILESGIEIIARPPGKRLQGVSLLSGGERTLTAVALLFAIYLVKPSPFCVLDELDAALDDANIGRFIKVLKEFLEQSQFLVITHNRQTIAAADILYGITMEEFGVSKVVSMKFSDQKNLPSEPTKETAKKASTAEPSSVKSESVPDEAS